jgi:hypothetical protein
MANVFSDGPSLIRLSVGKGKSAKEAYGLAVIDDIVAALKSLPKDISLKYQMRALRKAAKPGQEALRAQVGAIRQVTGNLLASVTKVEREYTNNRLQVPVGVVVVGFRRPTGQGSQKGATPAFDGGAVLKGPNRAYHSHLVEYGTKPRTAGKSTKLGRKRVVVNGRLNTIFLRGKAQASPRAILSSFKGRGRFTGAGRGQYPKDFIATGTVAGSPARHPLRKAFQQSQGQMQSILDAEMRKALTRAVKETERRFGDLGGF